MAIVIPGWYADRAYRTNELVIYSGDVYISLSEQGGNLPTDTTYWSPFTPEISTGTKTNGTAATATLTFSGVVADGQTVTIGADVYEFDTNAAVTGSNILVDMSGGVTASAAVTALVAAITASTTEAVSAVDGAGDTVVVTADSVGVSTTALDETCTNGLWNHATLFGGVAGDDGYAGQVVVGTSYLYACVSTNVWKRAALSSF